MLKMKHAKVTAIRLPVVTVNIIQPAALFHNFNRSRNVLPCCKAVSSFIFIAIARFNATTICFVLFPATIVENALLRL